MQDLSTFEAQVSYAVVSPDGFCFAGLYASPEAAVDAALAMRWLGGNHDWRIVPMSTRSLAPCFVCDEPTITGDMENLTCIRCQRDQGMACRACLDDEWVCRECAEAEENDLAATERARDIDEDIRVSGAVERDQEWRHR